MSESLFFYYLLKRRRSSMYRTREAKEYWTMNPMEPVKIRMGSEGIAADEPLTIQECLFKTAEKYPNRPALAHQDDNFQWKTATYGEYKSTVEQVAKAFIKLGLEPHNSVGILAFNCPEWFYAALGAVCAGGLEAGIYTTNSAEAIYHILKKSHANVLVVDDEKQLEKILSIKDHLPLLKAIVQLSPPFMRNENGNGWYYKWTDLLQMDVSSDVEREYHRRLSRIRPNQAAGLVFTSGTIGMPKGVMLSHDNITFNAKQIALALSTNELEEEVLVSYLPLSHVAAQLLNLFFALRVGAVVYFADKNALKGSLLVKTLRVARPTRFMAVPRVFEKMQESLVRQIASSKVTSSLYYWASYYATQHYEDLLRGQPSYTWSHWFFQRVFLNGVKAGLGLDRCVSCFNGAAPVSIDVKKFFLGIDIPLLEVYGLSETAGPLSVGNLAEFDLGSAGKPLPGTMVKINSPDSKGEGEVLVKGRHVFMGYIGEEEKTKEALDEDGFLHTGDLGYLDDQGFLYITGRSKELIITAGGENIPPIHIENLVKRELPCVSNAVLVGDQRKFLTMLITLKTETDPETGAPLDTFAVEARKWLNHLGLDLETLSELLIAGPCPLVKRSIESGIVRANKHAISNAQKVQKFEILPHDFSIATGELGPTLKVKRKVVLEKYADVIEKMYRVRKY